MIPAVLVALAVVTTGNHYVLDAVVGLLIALSAYALERKPAGRGAAIGGPMATDGLLGSVRSVPTPTPPDLTRRRGMPVRRALRLGRSTLEDEGGSRPCVRRLRGGC